MKKPEYVPPKSLDFPGSLYSAIGQAIESYANVEAIQAMLLQLILKVNIQKSHLIFFSIQNTRLRNDLFQSLLEGELGEPNQTILDIVHQVF